MSMSIAFRRRLAPSLILLIALAAACDGGPSAPATPGAVAPLTSVSSAQGADRQVREALIDLTGLVIPLPCGPDAFTEEVRLFGQIHLRQTRMSDGAGGFHFLEHTMPIGLGGVGLTSGAAYRVSEREHVVANSTPMASNGSYRYELKVSAPEIGLRGRLVLGGRYTVNANGEIVVERPTLQGDCRA